MRVPSLARPSVVLRALTVGALTGALALVPGVASAHGPGQGHHPPRPPANHAPDRPADVRTTAPDSTCSAAAAAPLRSATPTLRATLTDRDGDAVRAVFELRDVRAGRAGKLLWTSGPTTAQVSGAQHAVEVPSGVMRDGQVYEWRVQARDARDRTSPVVRCRVVIDATAPGATRVTAVEGAGAVYAEETVAGGIGVAGAFRFEAPGSTDVVAFLYGFNGGQERVDVVPGEASATVTWTPTYDGTYGLTVQAVDAAGNVGPEQLYRFTVASAASAPTGNALWRFDEGQGATAFDALGQVPFADLTVSPTTTWVDGLLAELAGDAEDRALLFDEPTDLAASDVPVVDTTGSFSVAAVVRVDAEGAATFVSQAGAAGDAFTLGTSTTSCVEDMATCWSFGVAGAGSSAVATSVVPVTPGSWYGVFGVRNAGTGVVRVDVCEFDPMDVPGPQAGEPVSLVGATASSGPLRVGSGHDGAQPWVGAVSGLRTWGGVIDVTSERVICSRGL